VETTDDERRRPILASQAGRRAMSAFTRFAARDITARGGRVFPSARQAATVLNRREATVPQQPHVSR